MRYALALCRGMDSTAGWTNAYMSLSLEAVSRVVANETHLDQISLTLDPGSFNVLLGRTLAGKTSLMRLMAGLDRPSSGRILMSGEDVTERGVRQRNVSMVYQQFINYPHQTVFDNIASPLKIARVPRDEIQARVHEVAKLLHIEHLLERMPLELSGGQQQRTAMARALVKDADLVLFDEPLVNLDYKLREEFREELGTLFASRDCIAVYATTEPAEALALGGHTAILHEGRLIQYGPTPEVYRQPMSLTAAEMFSEPPINVLDGYIRGREVTFDEDVHFPLDEALSALAEGHYRFGVRPSHLALERQAVDDLVLDVQVDLAEISGSETFLHVHNDKVSLVAHLAGVHSFAVDQQVSLYFPVHGLYAFDDSGATVHAPDASPSAGSRGGK
ncbi:carbohydrate ABC transporter ATP-binding protein, CUT1 family (TC 3.A.1.1.-) [Halomonas cupida]|uniref:Carbohydrate ABC transporter ATP-binding protein, CUT1 family (TC 3.A.1.1.-) n=2 Tax=Halomonas cupida TaxID=44933 RepID=A0A1M7AMR8_9GAMM|nr:carbohydrate ABC transporter ATP-binding protein, CUT1 family (TC 3.A.1.1.-) [Halomonas cupida]